MDRNLDVPVPTNPFCTRCVRPGAVPFRFPEGETADGLADRLRDMNWRGAIVGPHGSGKSTLLAVLLPLLQSHQRHIVAIALHDGQRRLPEHCRLRRLPPNTLLVIDGYEQLGFIARVRLRWHCRRRKLGLLVTSHASVGLPVLFRTQVDLPLAQQIASELQDGFQPHVHPDDVARAFAQCDNNLRELLFSLFDLYEARQRKGR